VKSEIKRRIFHIVTGSIIAILYYLQFITALNLAGLLVLSAIVFLIYKYVKIPVLHKIMLELERKRNLEGFPGIGVVCFLLGASLTAWLYPPNIAVAAILILAWGDGIAGLIGPYGKKKYFNKKKTWEGILAGIIAGTVAAQFFVAFLPALIASLVMLIEGLDLKIGKWKIDDNIFIPLISGLIIVLLS